MVNPRFLELAKRLGNEEMPKEETAKITPKRQQKILLDTSLVPQGSFILAYDNFGKELIRKSNELFAGTKAEIPLQDSGEVPNMYILKRLALITTTYNNKQLRSTNILPITPEQSELLLKEKKSAGDPAKYWEDLALILYDRSENGINPKEAQALYQSLKKHRKEIGLSELDLENRLLIINAGIEKDSGMPYGVKPIVLPGLTQVYMHSVLEKTGSNNEFEYGLEQGLPAEKDLGKGDRTLYLPDETKDIGLRVLYRDGSLYLNAGDGCLVSSGSDGRVSFARQGAAKK